jgi:hypothetical protein
MARKPENTFIASVHKHLQCTYFEKMNNPYRSGTPDVWYSGDKSDLWAEYKFIQSIPVKVDVRLDLSELQKLWLRRRYEEGRTSQSFVDASMEELYLLTWSGNSRCFRLRSDQDWQTASK